MLPLKSLWLTFTIITVLMLGIAAAIFSYERSQRLQDAQTRLQTEIGYLEHTLTDSLQRGDFEQATAQVEGWGRLNRETLLLRLSAENGFVIAEFQRDPGPDEKTIRAEVELPFSYYNHAILVLEKTLEPVRAQIRVLGIQLLSAGLVVELLGFLLIHQLARHRHQIELTRLEYQRRLELQREMEKMATQDALTGLPNRRQLDGHLRQRLAEAARFDHKVAVMFIDLDNFKTINDNFGHSVGDSLLRAVSERMLACLRSYDLLVRFGGDEFVVVLAGIDDLGEVDQVARKLIEAIRPSFDIDGRTLSVSASIGVSLYPTDASDGEGLLRHADDAMYAAKESGRNCFRHYSPGHDAPLRRIR
jgi:diguanylate cyclase (GGDEF)-like protein